MRILGREFTIGRSRWVATRVAARLGCIAATLSGLALAFQIGGPDGYALPLGYLLGAPTNGLVFRLLSAVLPLRHNLLASSGPTSEWSLYHLGFCACIALNWTLFGVLADLTRPPSPRQTVPAVPVNRPDDALLPSGDLDPLLREFEELERRVREPRQTGRPRSRRLNGREHR